MKLAVFFTVQAVCLMLSSTSVHATIWHVRQDGSGDATSITGAFYYSNPGDTILVGPGTYCQPPIYLEPVHLISEDGPKTTIIRICPQTMDDVNVIFILNISTSCSVQGFTITGARNGFLDAGGGIFCYQSLALIKGNIIIDNWCSDGGGISCNGSPSPVVENNLFCYNGAVAGAAISIMQCSPIILSNTIASNYASDGAGAIVIFGNNSYPIITNNIIVDNQCNSGAKGAVDSFTPFGQIVFTCNDVWSNRPRNYDGTMPDQTGLNGNISLDPLFCGVAGSGNFYLQAGSPCAEGNVPQVCGSAKMGSYEVNCTVAVETSTWGSIKSLFKEGKK